MDDSERDVIESLFRKDAVKNGSPVGTVPTTGAVPSKNSWDVFPAPNTASVKLYGPWDKVPWDRDDLYWNVFDVQGILTSSIGPLIAKLGTTVRIHGRSSIAVVAITEPLLWNDNTAETFKGPRVRFAMVCACPEAARKEERCIESYVWPDMRSGQLYIMPRVAEQVRLGGGGLSWRRHGAGIEGAPFQLYRAIDCPVIAPHYSIDRLKECEYAVW